MSDLRFNTGAPERQVTASADFSESFDARDWAKAFVEHVTANPAIAADEGTMLAWFANALMRGYDEREKRMREAASDREQLRTENEILRRAIIAHRADLHNGSSRPCPTCYQSAHALGIADRVPNRCALADADAAALAARAAPA